MGRINTPDDVPMPELKDLEPITITVDKEHWNKLLELLEEKPNDED